MARLSILIVEDDALIAMDLRRELEASAIDVVGIADNYDQAIKLAEAETPDIACVDIRIKGRADGITVARRLRDMGLHVVMMTANPDLLTPDIARHVVVKPFHPQSVLAEIRALATARAGTA